VVAGGHEGAGSGENPARGGAASKVKRGYPGRPKRGCGRQTGSFGSTVLHLPEGLDGMLHVERNTSRRRRRLTWVAYASLLIACLVVLGFAARRFIISDVYALAASIQDDSFYYLVPAHGFWETGFFSFDGQRRTYGFQPLYMLLLTSISPLCGGIHALLRVSLVLNAVFHCLTCVLLFGIIHHAMRRCRPAVQVVFALLGSTAYLANITLFLGNTTAKENALAALLFALLIALVIRMPSARRSKPSRSDMVRALLTGLACGLLILCRVLPTTFLAVGVFTLITCVAWWRVMPFFVGLAPPLLAWFFYAKREFGGTLPTSGVRKVTGFDALLDRTDLAAVHDMAGLSIKFIGNAIAYSLDLGNAFWIPQPDKWSIGASGSIHASIAFKLVMMALVFLACLAIVGSGKFRLMKGRGGLLLAALLAVSVVGYVVIVMMFYHTRHGELFYYSWYLYDLPLILALLMGISSGLGVQRWLTRWRRWQRSRAARRPRSYTVGTVSVIVAGLVCIWLSLDVYRRFGVLEIFKPVETSWQSLMIHSGLVLRDEIGLAPEDRVGAFSSGALAFTMPGRVVNLDGLANDEVLAFRARGESWGRYFEQEGITYYVDVIPPDELDPELKYEILRATPMTNPNFSAYYIARIQTGA
jgi:hypothetical protein